MLMNIFESIKSFFINYFSFGDIIKELLPGFIIACLTALACFVYNRNSKKFYTALHKAMYGVAKYDKDSYKVFKNYIPHMLTKITHRDTDAEETVSFKEFCKKIERDEIKCVFVVGPSGIGKSTLLQQLAFRFKDYKFKNKAEGILDYGIIYEQFSEKKIDSLFENIKENLSRSRVSECTLILDAFDESPDLISDGVEEAFDRLMEKIRDINNLCVKRVILSLRPEIFSNGIYSLRNTTIYKGNTAIYAVERFNSKQIIKMYKKISLMKKESSVLRKKHLTRLDSIVSESGSADCVFSYPFILSWAPELFETMSDNQLKEQNMYNIIDTIIQRDLEREYEICINAQEKRDAINKDACIKSGRDFVRSVAKVMLADDSVSNVVINYDFLKRDNDTSLELLLNTTRRLLRCESLSKENKASSYTFLHNMFYWFEVADILSDVEEQNISLEDRKRYLEFFKNTPVPSLYVQALAKKTGDYFDFPDVLPESPVELTDLVFDRKESKDIFVDKYIPLFPYINTLTVNGVRFNNNDISDLLCERELCLSDKGKGSLTCAFCFSPEHVKTLDIDCCDAENAEEITNIVEYFVNLEELWINEDDTVFGDFCKKLEKSRKKEISKIKVVRRDEAPAFDPIYKDVYNLRKNGVDISFWDFSRPPFSEKCDDKELLEAIYELDKLCIENADEDVNAHFLYAAYLYVLQLDNNQERIKEVFDFVIRLFYTIKAGGDIIVRNAKAVMPGPVRKVFFLFVRYAAECEKIINPVAQTLLGLCYQKSYETEENAKEAFKWYEKSAEAGCASGQYHLGWCYQEGYGTEEKPEEAFKWFKKSAEAGCAGAMYCLGWCYKYEYGTAENETLAFKWCKKSAEAGYELGMYYLGWCYKHGYCTAENKTLAFEWYKKSAEAGNSEGMNSLGLCYREGYGTEEKPEEAFKWFEKSAEAGCASGMYDLGLCYNDGYGENENKTLAFKWYKKSAEAGNTSGMNKLGWCYAYGYGTAENKILASEWYRKSAEAGCAEGMYKLGWFYFIAPGRRKAENKVRAFEWIKKSAEAGYKAGMNDLGWCYKKGEGTTENKTLAFEWFKKSAEAGYAVGMYNLGWCYEYGFGIEKDETDAFMWYEKSAKAGKSRGMKALSRCYENGIGTEPDKEQALYWQKKAEETDAQNFDDKNPVM